MNVKVWNDNIHPYKENFRDRLIEIPPGGSIEMDFDEAHLFMGTYAPIVKDGTGMHDPRSFKKLRIDSLQSQALPVPKINPLVCHACNKAQTSTKALSEHIEAEHKDLMVKDEILDAEIEAKNKEAKAKNKGN